MVNARITVVNNNVEKALKQLKRVLDKSGMRTELKQKEAHETRGQKRRRLERRTIHRCRKAEKKAA